MIFESAWFCEAHFNPASHQRTNQTLCTIHLCLDDYVLSTMLPTRELTELKYAWRGATFSLHLKPLFASGRIVKPYVYSEEAFRKKPEIADARLSKCVVMIPRWSPGTVLSSNSFARPDQTAAGSAGKSVGIAARTKLILPG